VTQHIPEVRPFYPATRKVYSARCGCGWQQEEDYPSREAAQAVVNNHISTTTNHPAGVV
jgi:hypothetical protein